MEWVTINLWHTYYIWHSLKKCNKWSDLKFKRIAMIRVISIPLPFLPICFSLSPARQTHNSISSFSLNPCRLQPNEYMLMYWCVSFSPSLPPVQQLPNHSFLTISHFCALSLSNLHLALPLSVWMVARPARQLSHGVESQHLVAGSDQSSPLETHQYPSLRIHTHTHARTAAT